MRDPVYGSRCVVLLSQTEFALFIGRLRLTAACLEADLGSAQHIVLCDAYHHIVMHATLMHSVKADRQHMRRQSTVNMPYNDGTHYDIPALACFPNTDYATQCGDDLTLHRLLADCGLSSGRHQMLPFSSS